MSTPPADGPRDLADLAAFSEGAIVSRMLLKRPGGSATLFAFAAGEGLSEHETPFDALIVVLDGTATITVGGAAHDVPAGACIDLPANVPHAVHAPGDVRLLLFMLRS
jgi:quercetin dioxygenase-like cupin family protein